MTKDRECDQLLVDRVLAGDKRAFDLLVTKYQGRLMRTLLHIVRDHVEAEDILQETFMKAYRSLSRFRGDAEFYTWIYRIGINAAKNSLRTKRWRIPSWTEADVEQACAATNGWHSREMNTPESLLLSKQIAETLDTAMNALSVELRTAVTLREIDGMSYEQISDAMACPIGTVRSRIFRARELIAAQLKPLLDAQGDKRW